MSWSLIIVSYILAMMGRGFRSIVFGKCLVFFLVECGNACECQYVGVFSLVNAVVELGSDDWRQYGVVVCDNEGGDAVDICGFVLLRCSRMQLTCSLVVCLSLKRGCFWVVVCGGCWSHYVGSIARSCSSCISCICLISSGINYVFFIPYRCCDQLARH